MKAHKWLVYICIIFIIAMLGASLAVTYDWRWWMSDYEKHLAWCKNVHPSMNTSEVAVCFTEVWVDYCKFSYPEYCPDNNYSEQERCIANCKAYGMEDNCPCGAK